jgi:hypothetical protein
VARTLVTGNLGYVYDRQQTVVAVEPSAQPEVLVGPLSLQERIADNTMSFLANASNQFAEAVSEGIQAPKEDKQQAIRLSIRGIEPPRNPNTVLDLFLNCEKLSQDTPITDPSYVGSCTFFIHGAHGHQEKDMGVSFAFDLTREFARLYGDRPLRKDEPLKVSVLARPLALDPDRAPEWNVKVQEISPEQVSIDVVRV